MEKKLAIIGLDCAEPSLVFGRWKNDLPNLSRLMDSGMHARLRSCHPPITIPAWTAMFSGKDPGALGIYGFRNRVDYSYAGLKLADGSDVHEPRLWDYLSRAGKTSIVIGVPQTYPVQPLQGYQIAGMPAERLNEQALYPPGLVDEIAQTVPQYAFDIKNFRNVERETLLRELYQMTRLRFQLARHLLDTRRWDLFMLVEIGPDRLQHAFWQYMAEDSIDFDPGNPFRQVIFKYYQYLDFEISTLLRRFDEHTDVLIVSDHGAKTFRGGFCINQWLMTEGYLRLKTMPKGIQAFDPQNVDWNKTRVWAEGGYYARIFLNIKGREAQGAVAAADVDNLKRDLQVKLTHIGNPEGRPLNNIILDPQRIYSQSRGIPPDLMVYCDDLNLRAIASVGWDTVFTTSNDSGPDGANHDYHGIFILQGAGIQSRQVDEISIYDVLPTVMRRLGLPLPENLTGKAWE
jgi:predicted AlkP superfamily phosphohydrolase/phosphomutase